MTDQTTQIIEINGMKFEVDARTATLRQVSTVKVGARVKVLIKDYSDKFTVYHGVVVGFEPFKEFPVVIVAYITSEYGNNPSIKFLYYTEKSQEKIIVSDENDRESLEASNVVAAMEREIQKKRNEITDLEDRKQYFLSNFQSYWQTLEVVPAS